ncbi:hypothetical protein VB712_10200 [Spirulina sp. CCNP1310]|nr:hypothetical protein [Spirulina sp. CCNP1310]
MGDISLTEHEDIWSKTIRDRVLVSAYPLAAWLVSSWWRLLYEPLPPAQPSISWRMAHELTAANQGFIWPRVIFASDTQSMQLWSTASEPKTQQSVRYLNRLEQPFTVNLLEFEQTITNFIQSVICRLDATEVLKSPLANLWQEVQEEREDANANQYRRCEAQLGFDPDDCPESIVIDALNWVERMGKATFSEVAPACSQNLSAAKPLSEAIAQITAGKAIKGQPQVSIDPVRLAELSEIPWQKGKEGATLLRNQLDLGDKAIQDEQLYELLSLPKFQNEAFDSPSQQKISIAIPSNHDRLKFYLTKKHPTGKRFELARLIGDALLYGNCESSWLASTGLKTSRQKSQRAFAAELLCPVNSLMSFLNFDYSESALEDAAEYFHVSSKTIESILTNHGLIHSHSLETSFPY